MADGLSVANANLALNAIVGTNAAYVELHTADPGSAGTTAVSSTTTREAVTWASASGGSVSANGTLPAWPSWAGTPGEVVTDVAFFSAASSGNFGFSAQLSASATMALGDTLSLTSITVSLPTAS